jgi:uncharacterized protein YbjQ (UPF0145 family)
MAKCTQCGANAGMMMSLCENCIKAQEAKREEEYSKREQLQAERTCTEAEFEKSTRQIILTTAPNLEGYRVVETLEIVTSECVFGMNMFRDIFAAFTDTFGGRSEASQKVLRDARKTCLLELKKEAAQIGADAVIAVDLDYNEFSGGGKSMLFLVASGTAVRVERL